MVNHVLCENVHVGDIGRSNGTCRLSVLAADTPSDGPAGKTARQDTWIIFSLTHGVERDRFTSRAAVLAAANLLGVGGARRRACDRRPGLGA